MILRERIEEVLEHWDYCLVTVNGHSYDNVVVVEFPTTNAIMFRDFTITFGADRVSRSKGKIKITGK